jgi:hypothetical protein
MMKMMYINHLITTSKIFEILHPVFSIVSPTPALLTIASTPILSSTNRTTFPTTRPTINPIIRSIIAPTTASNVSKKATFAKAICSSSNIFFLSPPSCFYGAYVLAYYYAGTQGPILRMYYVYK